MDWITSLKRLSYVNIVRRRTKTATTTGCSAAAAAAADERGGVRVGRFVLGADSHGPLRIAERTYCNVAKSYRLPVRVIE